MSSLSAIFEEQHCSEAIRGATAYLGTIGYSQCSTEGWMAQSMEVIAGRLDKLDRENRMLKRIGALVTILAGAVLLMAQAPARPRTLEAEKIIIRYPNGKEAI